MQDSNLIDQLIDAYHVLNTHVRGIAEERTQARTASGESVEDIVRRMRDDELRFSQALRQRVTGLAMPDIFGEGAAPVIGAEAAEETTSVLIAQFGSAREVTLALLRHLTELEWDQPDSGGRSIRASVADLAANDQRQLAKIATQLDGAASA